MRPSALLGILLILCGILAFTYQGVIWVTGRESVAQFGPIAIQRDKPVAIPLAPIVGGGLIAGGILLTAAGSSKTRQTL